MSIIPCTESCIYQTDGNCGLERAASLGMDNDSGNQCAYYIKKAAQ